MDAAYENWAKSASTYFAQGYGLNGAFALAVARLYISLWAAGLSPRITSGFRDPAKQREMQARWDAGDRAGLRVRPATTSAHSTTSFIGAPAATAIDMPCTDEKRGAAIAKSLGLGAGLAFSTPDPGHYYLLGGA